MLFRVTAFLFLISLGCSQVISRNGKIVEQMDKFRAQIDLYDELIEISQTKLKEDLETCIQSAKESNCSKLSLWQHERIKHSKNITNLENKIKNHQNTIQNIITLNQQETRKKSLTLQRLLPELIKAKNDIEYIEGIQFLIQDTYLNIDDSEESIMNIFDSQFGNPVQLQLIELMKKAKYDHDPGAHPQQQEYLPEKPEEEPPVPRNDYFQGPPLIDEVIFDGHTEQYPQATVRDLFNSLGGMAEPAPIADPIPDAVNVPEHDANSKQISDIVSDYSDAKANEEPFENLQVAELQADFKIKIKTIGQELYDKLDTLRKALSAEQDRLAQAVADLEKAILNLHHRHAKQIVQIYIESKRLQRLVFEKDDTVLHLDGLIHDCTNLQQKLKNCENNKGYDLHYIQDIKQQKELNIGILKELEKLSQYADANIDTPVIPLEEVPSPQAEEIKEEIQNAQEEMHQIAEAEKQVETAPTQAPPVEVVPVQATPAPQEQTAPVEAIPVPQEQTAPVEATPASQEAAEESVPIDAPVVSPQETAQPAVPALPQEPQTQEQPAQPQEQPAQPQEQPAQPQEQPAQPQEQPAQPQEQPAQPQEQPAQPQVETTAEVPAVETEDTPAIEAKEEPAVETPAVETTEAPAVETPAVETTEAPAVETPAVETTEAPAVETPAVETTEAPVVETPVVETTEAPAVETPAVEAPAVETPAVETTEAPAVETPAVEAKEEPAVETPAVETKEEPAVETPAVETPAVETTEAPAVETTEAPAVETPAVEAKEAPAVEGLVHLRHNKIHNKKR